MTPNDAAVIAAKLDALTDRFERFEDRTDKNFEKVISRQDHTNGRVRSLELKWAGLGAVVAAAVLLAPFVLPRLV